MRILRLCAALLGSSLMIGETIRSWGQGRQLLFILDDFFIGVPLVLAAFLMAKPSAKRHALLTASFAAAAGMLYGSFFGKLFNPSAPASTNIEIGVLTTLIGMAFVVALLGLGFSIYLSGHEESG